MRFNRPDFRDSSFMRLRVLTSLRSEGALSDTLEWNHAAQGSAAAAVAPVPVR